MDNLSFSLDKKIHLSHIYLSFDIIYDIYINISINDIVASKYYIS